MSYKDAVTPSSSEHLTGRVKWFNNKAGYGFITITDGSRSGSDIFVHHSDIGVSSQQYKYLVQGEYVDFDLSSTQGGKYEFQATNVAGIKGGKLMCETRHEFKVARNNYKGASSSEEPRILKKAPTPTTKTTSAPRSRGEGPRDSEQKEWSYAKGSKNSIKEKPAAKPRGRPPNTLNK